MQRIATTNQYSKNLCVSEKPPQPIYSQKEVNAVIIGDCGAGKTNLLNNLCSTQHKVGQTSLSSLTRGFVCQKCTQLDKGNLNLLDSPGMNAIQQIKKHAMMVKECLTICQMNAIFIVVPFQCRLANTIDRMLDIYLVVEKYAEKVIFMVSKIDLGQDPIKTAQAFRQQLRKQKMYRPTIFFSGIDCDYQQLAEIMYSFASNIPQTQMFFTQKQFYSNFNLSNINQTIKKRSKPQFAQAEQITQQYIELMKMLPDNDQKNDILRILPESLRHQLETIMNQIYSKFEQTQEDRQYLYSIYLGLQAIILQKVKLFINLAQNYKKQQYIFWGADQQDLYDPRNLFRTCPHCGQIWMKVEGCRDNTTCGQSVGSAFDFFKNKTKFNTYKIVRKGNKIQIEKTQKDISFAKNQNNKGTQEKRIGCGQTIAWKNMQPHPDAAKFIREIYSNDKQMIKNLDHYIETDKKKLEKQHFKNYNQKILEEVKQNAQKIKKKLQNKQ